MGSVGLIWSACEPFLNFSGWVRASRQSWETFRLTFVWIKICPRLAQHEPFGEREGDRGIASAGHGEKTQRTKKPGLVSWWARKSPLVLRLFWMPLPGLSRLYKPRQRVSLQDWMGKQTWGGPGMSCQVHQKGEVNVLLTIAVKTFFRTSPGRSEVQGERG